MKKVIVNLVVVLILLTAQSFAQNVKEYKAGNVFYVSLPEYMSKTTGLNSVATIQYKSVVKDVYGFVIEDTKEDLKLVEMSFTSVTEFYDEFMKTFIKDEDKRVVSGFTLLKKGETNFVEADLTYYDKDAKAEIYYLIGIVETKTAYYKVLSWALAENKDKFKADFQKILYSLKD